MNFTYILEIVRNNEINQTDGETPNNYTCEQIKGSLEG